MRIPTFVTWVPIVSALHCNFLARMGPCMKVLTPIFTVALLAFALSGCEAVNRPGDIVSEKIITYNGKYFRQQRIIRATQPYETELRTVQFPVR